MSSTLCCFPINQGCSIYFRTLPHARAGTLLRISALLNFVTRVSFLVACIPVNVSYMSVLFLIVKIAVPPLLLVNLWYRSSSWLTADFSAMTCWSAHANSVWLFSKIRRLDHIFLGFTHDHLFPLAGRMVSAESPIWAHRMLSLTDRALLAFSRIYLYKSLFRITCKWLFFHCGCLRLFCFCYCCIFELLKTHHRIYNYYECVCVHRQLEWQVTESGASSSLEQKSSKEKYLINWTIKRCYLNQ